MLLTQINIFPNLPEIMFPAPPNDDLYPREQVSQHGVIEFLHETLLLVSRLVHVEEVNQRLYCGA